MAIKKEWKERNYCKLRNLQMYQLMQCMVKFGSLFEQTNYKDASLKQLGNTEYRSSMRCHQRIIVNFGKYDNKIMVLFKT